MNASLPKFNNLFFYFLVTQLGFYVAPFFAAPPIEITYDIAPALIVHTLSILAFAGGYLLNDALRFLCFAPAYRSRRERVAEKTLPQAGPQWTFGRGFFIGAYVLMGFGIFVIVLQIALFRSPTEYLSELLGGSYDINVRNAFLASHEEGGLSGLLKMFTAVPLAIYLCSLSILHFIELTPEDRVRFERLNRWALVMTGLKVLFSLDRLTILAVVIANVFLTVRTRKRIGLKVAAVIVFLFLVEFVSQKRIEGQGASGFMVLYYNLGIVNLQLLLDTLQGHTQGFSSILSPLLFVLKAFGLEAPVPDPPHSFEYVDAHYLLGYVYLDFGPLFWLFYVALGALYKTIDRKAHTQRSLPYVAVYLLVLSVTITYVAVPGFKSVDFWLGILVPLILVRFYARRVPAPQEQQAETPLFFIPPQIIQRRRA